ncbi:IclR family transcriptional regulator [Salinibacterium sp. dk2585]|uniref:IclR family transcriptional regulator n=1 Tax=unclassified Salinibacterium TaxID=2632331 RepID=UPI0011C24FA1|nr:MULTISPECIES: IclR family transcriptional regulator [unclassified Salinibacterium]QEE62154.1 IclR family transcriptional regulator [Salinibacterium sp. dk2585]TXK53506.1 IclR family transcriptional regulator [Salinibacterium sp. dk5596]
MANSPSGDSLISRVVRILETFDTDRTSRSVSDIARRTGIPSSTTHRLVAELSEHGLLERDERGNVHVGMRLWELAMRGSQALRLRQIAIPFMESVQAKVRQHTQLAVLEDDEALFIERLSSRDSGANITRIAGRLPLHASSSGLVLLANADAALQDRVLAGELQQRSAETVTDPARLRSMIGEIRRIGHVIAPGYIAPESVGVAVPVKGPGGGTIAALSVVLPRDHGDVGTVVMYLKSASTGITRAMRDSQNLSH